MHYLEGNGVQLLEFYIILHYTSVTAMYVLKGAINVAGRDVLQI